MIKKCIPLLLLILAASIIFYRFNEIPQFLAFDEVDFAKLAQSLDNQSFTPYSPLATGHATPYFYIILFSFKIFGVTSYALRLPAAIFGVLCVFVFYHLVKTVFTKSISMPLLATVTFLSLRWYFNFARYAFEATFLLFLELVSLYFLSQFLKQMKGRYLVLSGIFAGVAFNSYLPGRLFFLIPLSTLMYVLWKKKLNIKKFAFHSTFFLLPFFILILPLTIYLTRHPDIRVDQQFYWKNSELGIEEKLSFLGSNIRSLLLVFHFQGDMNGRHNYPGKPTLNPIYGLLFVIGLVISAKKITEPVNAMFIGYFVLSLIPTLLTYPHENPNILRIFTAIPAVAYFIALASYHPVSFLKKTQKKYYVIAIAALLSIAAIYEIRTYFKFQSLVFPHAFEVRTDLKSALEGKIK